MKERQKIIFAKFCMMRYNHKTKTGFGLVFNRSSGIVIVLYLKLVYKIHATPNLKTSGIDSHLSLPCH
jgi:hypothetical protein